MIAARAAWWIGIIASAITILAWLSGTTSFFDMIPEPTSHEAAEQNDPLIAFLEKAHFDILIDVSGSMRGFAESKDPYWHLLLKTAEARAIDRYSLGEDLRRISKVSQVSIEHLAFRDNHTNWQLGLGRWTHISPGDRELLVISDEMPGADEFDRIAIQNGMGVALMRSYDLQFKGRVYSDGESENFAGLREIKVAVLTQRDADEQLKKFLKSPKAPKT
jgi:hypothetical protein